MRVLIGCWKKNISNLIYFKILNCEVTPFLTKDPATLMNADVLNTNLYSPSSWFAHHTLHSPATQLSSFLGSLSSSQACLLVWILPSPAGIASSHQPRPRPVPAGQLSTMNSTGGELSPARSLFPPPWMRQRCWTITALVIYTLAEAREEARGSCQVFGQHRIPGTGSLSQFPLLFEFLLYAVRPPGLDWMATWTVLPRARGTLD